MKNNIELDAALNDLMWDNQTVHGLLNSLSDTFDYICSPIGNKQILTDEQQTMISYELLRDKGSIDALLRSLKHFTNEQGKKLDDAYDKFINKELAAERKEGAEHE